MTCLASTTSFRAIHHPLSAKEKAFFSVTPSLLMIREEEEEERYWVVCIGFMDLGKVEQRYDNGDTQGFNIYTARLIVKIFLLRPVSQPLSPP